MSTIPSNLARVSTIMISRITTGALARAQRDLFNAQIQLSTGRALNRPSDDAAGAAAVGILDDVIERRAQWLRNLSHGEAVLNTSDAALADAADLLIEAKGIASSQIGIGSDAQTRANQSQVVQAILDEFFSIANRTFQNVHLFGGSATAPPPVVELLGGFRYRGEGEGLALDLGFARPLKVTIGGDEAFGALSARVRGARDLDPGMTTASRLADLNGARGQGVSSGTVELDVGGALVGVDLSGAHTVGDVIALLDAGIQSVDPGASFGIAASGDGLALSGNTAAVTVRDPPSGAAAADLGIDATFPPGGGSGSDVDPRLTELTALSSLSGVTVPMGTVRLVNAGQTRDLDLSGAVTVRDLMNAVEGLDLGVRVVIAETGDRLDFLNELSGGRLSIGEVSSSPSLTATELGVRSLATWTLLSDFNDGRGVRIRSGSVDPITGLPDPQADLDMRITLKDGTTFDVDLAGAQTVKDVLDIINGSAGVAGVPLTAGLASDGNGIVLLDGAVGPNDTAVEALNGSFAAEDLGLLGSTTSAILIGEDRATVAVDSVFTHLIDLREALRADDETGITLAAERFEADIGRLAEARARVGISSRRIADATVREEDLRIQDMSQRSRFADLDFTEAAIRFSALQQQLSAGLATAARATSLSLLDFLR